MNKELRKQILEEVISQAEKTIERSKLEEGFYQRKALGKENPQGWEQQVGTIQRQIKMEKERLDYYRDKLKELK